MKSWRHDTQLNDTQHNDIQHNSERYATLNIMTLSKLAACCYTECPLCWPSLMLCHICWVLNLSPLCWLSLCWTALCWVSLRSKVTSPCYLAWKVTEEIPPKFNTQLCSIILYIFFINNSCYQEEDGIKMWKKTYVRLSMFVGPFEGATTFSITTLSIKTRSIMGLFVTL
jgi:hypothetical protein